MYFLFSFPPGRFGRLIGIGAAGHDLAHVFPEYLFDLALPRRAAAILHRIVEQRADRLGFIRAVFHGNRSHSQKMTDVGNPGFLAQLAAVDPCRVDQRLFEFGGRAPHVIVTADYSGCHGYGGSVTAVLHGSARTPFLGLPIIRRRRLNGGSRDRGHVGRASSATFPKPPVNDIVVASSVLSVGTDVGVLSSANGGRKWRAAGSMLPNVPMTDLEYRAASNSLYLLPGTFMLTLP